MVCEELKAHIHSVTVIKMFQCQSVAYNLMGLFVTCGVYQASPFEIISCKNWCQKTEKKLCFCTNIALNFLMNCCEVNALDA